MPTHLSLIDFTIDPEKTATKDKEKELIIKIETIIHDFFFPLTPTSDFKIDDGHIKIFSSELGMMIIIRVYKKGKVSLTIEEPETLLDDVKERNANIERMFYRDIEGIQVCQNMIPIKRGEIGYFGFSDERMVEYDIKEVLFNQMSQYQKIQIVRSKSFGRMLILDNVQNLAESDLIYTHTLMQKGKEDYNGKEIVILGGGDGALLHELLKEKPKFVTMLELDETVVQACSEHMKSVNGDILKNRHGDNYEIITADCVKYMEHFSKENKRFDYIFGDLTDVPVVKIVQDQDGKNWEFILNALKMVQKLLKPEGKYMTHVTGIYCQEALLKFEKLLESLFRNVTYKKDVAYVPSFMESWVFYQVQFTE